MRFEKFILPAGVSTEWKTSVDRAFENLVISTLISAYQDMVKERKYNRTWKETKFSAVLIGYMRAIRDKEDHHIIIDPEAHLYNKGILNGDIDPDTSPRIDIKVRDQHMKEDVYYGIEGKILVENNWNSKDASKLRGRYISTGIENFTKGEYGKKGCIAGYVVEGDTTKIKSQINLLMTKREYSDKQLLKQVEYDGFSDHYISIHGNTDKVIIRHLLLSYLN